MGKKRNFIPKQNTHDLLVGALSIGVPSNNLYFKRVTLRILPSGPLKKLIIINHSNHDKKPIYK